MAKISLKNLKAVPWFIASVNPLTIVTSKTIPETVSDSKQIQRPGTQTPGDDTDIPKFGSIASRRISFSIRLASFNNNLGVTPKIKALEGLRNASPPTIRAFGDSDPFTPNPTVYYSYGTGSLLLDWEVEDVSFSNSYMNVRGFPQVTDVSFRLVQNESSKLATAERLWRQTTALLGSVKSLKQPLSSQHPYRGGKRFI